MRLKYKNVSAILYLTIIIRTMNKTKSHSKYDHLFRKFNMNKEQYVRSLLQTEVRLLSGGNCLTKFVNLFEMIIHFSESKGDRFSKEISKHKKLLVHHDLNFSDFK